MPLRPVTFFKGGYYHIYNRGNAKREIFLGNRDYSRFLKRTVRYSDEHSISIFCFCLMPNHFHLLLKQTNETSVADFMQKLLVSYSMYFNRKYDNVGSVFQGRFQAKLIETDAYVMQISRYIHQNPWELVKKIKLGDKMTSQLLKDLEEYPWSSYSDYLGSRRHKFLEINEILSYFRKEQPHDDYREFVEEPISLQ